MRCRCLRRVVEKAQKHPGSTPRNHCRLPVMGQAAKQLGDGGGLVPPKTSRLSSNNDIRPCLCAQNYGPEWEGNVRFFKRRNT